MGVGGCADDEFERISAIYDNNYCLGGDNGRFLRVIVDIL